MERIAKENKTKPENAVKPIDPEEAVAEAEGLQYGSTGLRATASVWRRRLLAEALTTIRACQHDYEPRL